MRKLIFDFDGTLVDSMRQWAGKMINVLEKNSIHYPSDIIKIITPLGDRGAARYFIENLDLDMFEDDIISQMDEYAIKEYTYNISAKETVISTLKTLKAQGYSLNVLTASPHKMLDVCLKRIGIFDLFDNVWSCDDFGTTKADVNIYYNVAECLQTTTDNCLFFDDNLNALSVAKKSGMSVIGVYDESSAEYETEIRKICDKYIYKLNEFFKSKKEKRKMKLSIDVWEIVKRFGEERAFTLIKEAGFDCIDYSFYWLDEILKKNVFGDDYLNHAYKTKELLDNINLSCNQAHAPLDFNLETDTIDISNENYANIVKSLEIASILGAKNIVVHSVKPIEGESVLETNYRFYKSLEPFCEKFGIHIAIENLFGKPYDEKTKKYLGNRFATPDAMKEILSKLDSKWFVCCIDVGHATITGIEPHEFISSMDNNTLKALHIQDNDYEYDRHMLPFVGKINWDKTAESLKKINYDGEITFEIFKYLHGFDDEMMADVLKFAKTVGRYIIKKIEE